jgi:response regulator RpfG family c-di-GMP phosphodiesterase
MGLVENRVGEVASDVERAVTAKIEAKRHEKQSVAQRVERQHKLLADSYDTLAESVRKSYAQL